MPSEISEDLLPSEQARFEEVCRFGQDKHELLAETVAASFADDPLWQWIYETDRPVPLDQAMVLARLLVARMGPADEIHSFRHFGAIALWNPPDNDASEANTAAATTQAERFSAAFVAQLGDRIMLTGEFMKALHSHRPAEPHWYLSILGTHPERQSQGLGSQLLAEMHARLDSEGVPSYLESSNPRNYSFYRRHGYVEQGEIAAAGSPPVMAFSRQPR